MTEVSFEDAASEVKSYLHAVDDCRRSTQQVTKALASVVTQLASASATYENLIRYPDGSRDILLFFLDSKERLERFQREELAAFATVWSTNVLRQLDDLHNCAVNTVAAIKRRREAREKYLRSSARTTNPFTNSTSPSKMQQRKDNYTALDEQYEESYKAFQGLRRQTVGVLQAHFFHDQSVLLKNLASAMQLRTSPPRPPTPLHAVDASSGRPWTAEPTQESEDDAAAEQARPSDYRAADGLLPAHPTEGVTLTNPPSSPPSAREPSRPNPAAVADAARAALAPQEVSSSPPALPHIETPVKRPTARAEQQSGVPSVLPAVASAAPTAEGDGYAAAGPDGVAPAPAGEPVQGIPVVEAASPYSAPCPYQKRAVDTAEEDHAAEPAAASPHATGGARRRASEPAAPPPHDARTEQRQPVAPPPRLSSSETAEQTTSAPSSPSKTSFPRFQLPGNLLQRMRRPPVADTAAPATDAASPSPRLSDSGAGRRQPTANVGRRASTGGGAGAGPTPSYTPAPRRSSARTIDQFTEVYSNYDLLGALAPTSGRGTFEQSFTRAPLSPPEGDNGPPDPSSPSTAVTAAHRTSRVADNAVAPPATHEPVEERVTRPRSVDESAPPSHAYSSWVGVELSAGADMRDGDYLLDF